MRLQPSVVRANHHQIAKDYVENAMKAKLRTSIWGKYKQGFLFPLFIETVVHVSLEHRLFFAAFVRKNPRLYFEPFKGLVDASELHTLITDYRGSIYEGSHSIFDIFRLPASALSSGEVQIDELFDFTYDDEERMSKEGMKFEFDIDAVSQRLNPEGDKLDVKNKMEEEEGPMCMFTSQGTRVAMMLFLIRKKSVYH